MFYTKLDKFKPNGRTFTDSIVKAYRHYLFQRLVERKNINYIADEILSGYVKDLVGLKNCLSTFFGAPKLRNRISRNSESRYYWDDTGDFFVELFSTTAKNDRHYLSWQMLDAQRRDMLFASVDEFFRDRTPGSVYMIEQSNSGYYLRSMGVAKKEVQRLNYSKKVLEKYDLLRKELAKPDPCGRFAVIHGVPGCGKTHLVRGLLNDVDECSFVLVPAKLIDHLDGPSFVGALANEKLKDENKNRPFVLILEDADSCLVTRMGDNMSAISSLLNYTDGIFGMLLDLRVVATTNAKDIQFEPALMRPGRLVANIHVDKLSAEEAEKAYEEISGEKYYFNNPMTLAEVYASAKNVDVDLPMKTKKMGFFGK